VTGSVVSILIKPCSERKFAAFQGRIADRYYFEYTASLRILMNEFDIVDNKRQVIMNEGLHIQRVNTLLILEIVYCNT
jgi:hypothetical protein